MFGMSNFFFIYLHPQKMNNILQKNVFLIKKLLKNFNLIAFIHQNILFL